MKTVLDVTLSIFVPRLVMCLYTLDAISIVSNSLATIVLEVFFTSVTVVLWWLVVSCARMEDGSLTAVFAQVALLIDKVTNVVSNTFLALVNGGVVTGGAVFVDISDTMGTASFVRRIGVTFFFDVFAALSEVAFSVHQLADVFSHAVEALFSSLCSAVLVEFLVARVTFVMNRLSATRLMDISLTFIVSEIASLLHEVSSVLFDAFETILSLSNFVRTQLLKIVCAQCAVGGVRFWCLAN